MTPEEQRIAIAKACGWSGFHVVIANRLEPLREGDYGDSGIYAWHRTAKYRGNYPNRDIPHYLSDLNAMHEAEKVLGEEQHALFLSYLTHKDQQSLTKTFWPAVHATAPQRCEAFLRTLGLWTE